MLTLVGGAVDIAIRVVKALREAGCAVEGCPVEVERLMPADIPRTGEAVVDAMEKLRRKAIGLDRESIDARFQSGAFSGIDDGDAEREFVQRHNDLHGIDADAAAEVYGE